MQRRRRVTRYKTTGWTKIRRSDYGKNWSEVAEEVKREANYTCCKCGRSKRLLNSLGIQLHADHIRRLADGGTTSKRNLRCICSDCHSKLPGHSHMKSLVSKQKKKARAKHRS